MFLIYVFCWLQVGADIVKRALSYPLKLIAKNAGVNGSVVSEKVWITAISYIIACLDAYWLLLRFLIS